MAGIYRGSTPTFKLKPVGVNVADLGEPSVSLTQDLVFIDLPVTVDAENNCVIAKLSYSDSLLLVPDTTAVLQAVYLDESGEEPKVVPFSEHVINILQSHIEFVFDDEGNVLE